MSVDDAFDYDEPEEMHTELREHLLASDVVLLAAHDQGEATEAVVGLLRVVRHTSAALRGIALALRRVPTTVEVTADRLEELADALDELAFDDEEDES
jgi:hypothetical protein